MVDSEGRVAWEPVRGPDNVITGITMTADAEKTRSYLRMFRELQNLDCTRPYSDTDSFIDPHSSAAQRGRVTMAPAVPVDTNAFKEFEHHGWETSVSAYDEFFAPLTRLTIGPLLDGVNVEAGMRVLDVATGPGYVAAAARRRGASVVGVDFSARMIALARSTNAAQDILFQIGDAEALPSDSASFDAVVMNFGILHLAQPEKAIHEAHRVLKPGGSFGFSVWAKPEEAEGFAVILRAIETYGNPNAPLPIGPPFFRFSDPIECETTLEQAGFSATAIVKVPLIWRIGSADDLFTAFYEGTARTGGLLRAQTPECVSAIKEGVRKHGEKYLQSGKLSIPMPALIVTARKP
jgi:SAM-dependent methyltransferase